MVLVGAQSFSLGRRERDGCGTGMMEQVEQAVCLH